VRDTRLSDEDWIKKIQQMKEKEKEIEKRAETDKKAWDELK
jgi:hypothetical protein